MMKDNKSALAAVSSLSTGLVVIRKRITKLKAEVTTITAARVPVEEALERMHAAFTNMAARYETSDLDFDSLTSVHYQGWGLRPFPYSDDPMGLAFNGAMWAFFSETLTPAIETRLRQFYATQPGPFIRSDAKPAMLQKIESQILDLEFEEEAIISDAATAGINLMRRADADPRAVLNLRDPEALAAALKATDVMKAEEISDGD